MISIHNMHEIFRPLAGASNPHLQTLLHGWSGGGCNCNLFGNGWNCPMGILSIWPGVKTPSWHGINPEWCYSTGWKGIFTAPMPTVCCAPGKDKGWLGVVMHFRGCSGEPNRKSRIYHSGETEDARFFLRWLRECYGQVPTAAVGVSLGGNMLALYLAEQGQESLLEAAVVVSAPLMLEPCANRMEQGFSRVYQRYLLNQLKLNATRKLLYYPDSLPLDLPQLKGLRRIKEFDDVITARIHGFNDALDYYRRCSALPLLPQITTPLLIIHAKDDPFMTAEVIPNLHQLPDNIDYQLTEHGGHVGFVSGSLKHPQMWLEQRIPAWLSPYLEQQS